MKSEDHHRARPGRSIRRLLVAAALVAATLSSAWCSEPLPAPHPAPAESHYWAGVALLQRGMLIEAAAEFERALMENPEHAGAWFDYALTLCQLGERESCRSVTTSALTRFGTPPALIAARPPALDWAFDGQLRVAAGGSSNLTKGIGSKEIPLFLDGIELRLPVAGNLKPQPAAFLETGLDMSLRNRVSGFDIELAAFLREPSTDSAPATRALAFDAGWVVADGQRAGVLAYAITERSKLVDSAIYSQGLWWELSRNPNKSSLLALTLEQRRLEPLGERYLAGRFEAGHVFLAPYGMGPFRVQVSAETESKGERPGGSQHRIGLTVRKPVAIGAALWESALRGQYAWDSQVYSPLLGEEKRRTVLLEAMTRLTWPIRKDTVLHSELRALAQTSNLEMFRFNEVAASVGATYRW